MDNSAKVLVFHLIPEKPLRSAVVSSNEDEHTGLPDGTSLTYQTFDPSLYRGIKWGDKAKLDRRLWRGCGVAILGAYAAWERTRYVFNSFSLRDFEKLAAKADEVVGFSSLSFADNVLRTHGCRVRTTYDLYFEARKAAAAPGTPLHRSCKGDLSTLAKLNLDIALEPPSPLASLWHQRAESLQQELESGRYIEGSPEYEEVFRQYSDFKNELVHHCLQEVAILWLLYNMRDTLIYPSPCGNGTIRLALPPAGSIERASVQRILLDGKR